eukprot:6184746-Pleurochrysis_carterae.AAC.1
MSDAEDTGETVMGGHEGDGTVTERGGVNGFRAGEEHAQARQAVGNGVKVTMDSVRERHFGCGCAEASCS